MKSLISVTILLCIGFISATQKRATSVCETDTCKQSAQYLLNAIDQTQNPCEDFYQFACGGFINKNPLPKDATEYGTHDVLTNKALELIQQILETEESSNTPIVKNAQSLYANCLKQGDDLALLKSEIENLGGWTIATPNQQPNNNSLEVLLASLTLRGVNTIIYSDVGVDLENSNQYIIEADYADIPFLVIPENDNNVNVYIKLATFIVSELGAPNTTATTTEINRVHTFGRQLNEIIPVEPEIVNYTQVYQKMTIGQLQQLTDPSGQVFNWLTYYNALFSSKLTSSEPVAVYNLDYLVNVMQLLKSTNKNTLVNYAIWSFIESYSLQTGGSIAQAAVATIETLTGTTAFQPKNTSCTTFTNNVFGFALARQYVTEAFPSINVEPVRLIAEAMKTSFQIGMSQTSYYDAKTLAYGQQKLGNIEVLIGYPSWINNNTAVQAYYNNFPPMNGAHFTNALNSQISLVEQNLKLLHTIVDRSSFNLIPSIVDGEYDNSNDALTLPAGILQQPYYTAGQLQFLDFGALGSLIGNLINNGINNIGSQFDLNGDLNDWWPEHVLDSIDDTLQCISNQFKSYCSPINPSECVNGTAAELDVLYGILGAYDAYQAWLSKNAPEQQLPGLANYTSNQLLFVNFAQRYCTATVPANIVDLIGTDPQLENRYAVIGALANLKEFSEAFQCPVGLMNRGNASCVKI